MSMSHKKFPFAGSKKTVEIVPSPLDFLTQIVCCFDMHPGTEMHLEKHTKKPQRLLWLGTSKGNRTPDSAVRGRRPDR